MNEFWGWVNAQLGTILGVVGIATGIWFYWLSRKPKIFGWQVMSQTPFLRGNTGIKIVAAEGQEITRAVLTIIRLGNRGKAAIRAADFDEPIKISFGRSKVVGAALSDRLERGIRANLECDGSDLKFTPSLLNKNDWFEVQVVTDGEVELPNLTARVADHDTEPAEIAVKRRNFWATVSFISGFVFIVFSITNVFLPSSVQTYFIWLTILSVLVYFFAKVQKSKAPTWVTD